MGYLPKLFNLKGKAVVITGGAGFLCGEMCRSFHHVGCSVAVLDADKEGADHIAAQIKKDSGKAVSFEMDVRRKQDYKSCLEKILEEFGRIDVLINGAGINAPTPFLDITEEEWDRILAVQLKGTMLSCQVFGRQMLKQGSGSIINISSVSAGPPLSKAFTYSVAKAGIKNLTQNLAREWLPRG